LSVRGGTDTVPFVRSVEVAGRILIATVFIGALSSKVASRAAFESFTQSLRQMVMMAQAAARPAALASVALEGLTAALLLVPVLSTAVAGFGLALVLLIVFTIAIWRSLARGDRTPCRCFGASDTPLGPGHIGRNLALMAVAGSGLVAALIGGRLDPAPALVGATVGLVLGVCVVMWDDLVMLARPMR
jgi:hypothetical protein